MPSALLWAYLEEMIFCNIAAQPDLRVWLACTFTGRAAAGKCIITGFVGMLFGMSFLTTVLYSAVGLVVFMLLTAYDTQKLSQMFSYYAYDGELAEKASIYGALTLYLDFINIFLYVVRLLGMNSRRRN